MYSSVKKSLAPPAVVASLSQVSEASANVSLFPGRRNTSSTDSIAAMINIESEQRNLSEARTILDKQGGRGNKTMLWPTAVTSPSLEQVNVHEKIILVFSSYFCCSCGIHLLNHA